MHNDFPPQCEQELYDAINATFDQLRPQLMQKYNQPEVMMDHLLGYSAIGVGIVLALKHFENITDDDLTAMMFHVRSMVHGRGMISEG